MAMSYCRNIIIGDNESGKSTLLEAIDVVLLQKYRNYDKYIIKWIMWKNGTRSP